MKSKKLKTTTIDPLELIEDWYTYLDPSTSDFDDHNYLFSSLKEIIFDMDGVMDVLLQIYDIARFVGFFINLVHLFILMQKELRGNLVYIVMTGICICDIIQTFGKITQLIMSHNIIYEIEPCFEGYKYSHLMVNLLAKTAQIMCRRCSGFLILYIAAFRTFSVMFPMSNVTHKMMHSTSGYFVVILSGLVCMGWSLGYYFQTRFKKVLYCSLAQKRPSYVPYEVILRQKWEFKYLFIDGVIALITCGLYVIVAFILVFALFKNRKRRKNVSNEKSSNPSKMIGFMAFTVFISETTYGLFHVANHSLFQDYEEQQVFEKLNSVVFTFLIFNSVVHVIICFFMSSQYRDTMRRLGWGGKHEKATKTVLENTINSVDEKVKVTSSTKKTY